MKQKLLALLFVVMPLAPSGASDLEYYLPPGEVVWLGDEQKFLLLEQSNRLAYARGSMVLVPEWGFHPYQSASIQRLYQKMPDYGWQSMALQAPTQNLGGFKWQQETTVRYPDPISDTELDNLRAQLLDRVSLAMEKSQEVPGPLIIVAEGISAGFLVNLFSTQRLPLPDALILYGAYLPQWSLNEELATELAQLQVPVLDLSPANGNDWVTSKAQHRRTMAQRYQHTAYRQRVIASGTHGLQPRHLEHHVYGWLRSNDF